METGMVSTTLQTPPILPTKRKGWEERFFDILKSLHGHYHKRVFHRLMNKSSTLRSSLKRRSRDYEVEFNMSLSEVRELIYQAYGKPCKYCKTQMNVSNMVCDHITPISAGGPSIVSNLHMICKSCNIKKGPLTGKDFKRYIAWIDKQPAYMSKYINRKLAAKEVFK